MKILLRTKNYIIGFIVAIISIFAINNNVNAEELRTYDITYENYINHFEANSNYYDILKGVVSQLTTLEQTYDVFITFSTGNSNNAFFYLYRKSETLQYGLVYFDKNYSSSTAIGYNLYVTHSNYLTRYYYLISVNLDTYNTSDLVFNYVNDYVSNNEISSKSIGGQKHIIQTTIFDTSSPRFIDTLYYSSADITYEPSNYVGSLTFEKINLTYKNMPLDYLTYYAYNEDSNPIKYGLLDTLKFMMNFNIENLGSTLDVITNNQLLLIPFAVILLIAVIRIFKVVL